MNDDELVPKKAKDSHPSRSGPSPERLLAHANALINRVSSFMTKPVDAKYGGKKPIVSSGEKTKPNVETAGVSVGESRRYTDHYQGRGHSIRLTATLINIHEPLI